MTPLDQIEFRTLEDWREVRKVNGTAWMVQEILIPPTLGKRMRQRVRRR